MSKYFKLVVNGSMLGQDVKNTFYYQSPVELLGELFPSMGAQQLAEQFVEEVWHSGWQGVVNETYWLESLDIYPLTEGFELIYSLPYTHAVNENGSGAGDNLGPAAVVNIKFNLGAMNAAQGLIAPKRGYVAISGVSESQADGGRLLATYYNSPLSGYGKLADKISSNLESVTPPAIWFPVRMKAIKNPITGGTLFSGVSDVQSAVVNPVISFRRSRKPQ
jgi:hypothetical protein